MASKVAITPTYLQNNQPLNTTDIKKYHKQGGSGDRA
jgi:hypothetical protein